MEPPFTLFQLKIALEVGLQLIHPDFCNDKPSILLFGHHQRMKFFRGLSGVVALWLLAVFFVVAFVGWDQLQDISNIHNRTLQLEEVNYRSHALHELELDVRKQAAYVHDFLISGSPRHIQNYRTSMPGLRKAIVRIAKYGVDVTQILHAVNGIDKDAEQVFALPFATGNMEGPILVQEMDDKLEALSQSLMQKHHNMDVSVSDTMRFMAGLHLDMREDLIASMVVLFALLAGLTAHMYLRMIRPLVILRSRVAQIGEDHAHEGQLIKPTPEFGDNEIGDLSRALNTMRESISQHQQALVHARSLQAHQEKMQALGLMTANIAHEVGNPLAAASVSLDIAAHKIAKGRHDGIGAHLDDASQELRRMDTIIRNILQFGRPSRVSQEMINLGTVIESSMQLVGLVRNARHVQLEYNTHADIRPIPGSEDMLRQVLVNLLLNAIDASPEAALVRIETGVMDGCMLLDVSDQGCGIEQQDVDAIFSPMFSTKQKGEGTGLGLSISRDLMRQMGGDLLLFANGPDGCTFRISLPESTGGEHADSDH